MIPSAEAEKKRAEFRRRAALPSGHPDEMTLTDWREAVAVLREDRMSASVSQSETKAKKAAPAKTAEELLKDW